MTLILYLIRYFQQLHHVHAYIISLFYIEPSSSPEITQVYPLSASNINVTWNEIPESDYNGIIINYEVKYRSVSKDVGGMSLTMNTTGRSINLSGLKAFTEYNISVRGYTSAGPGPFSEELTRRTMNGKSL